MTPLLLAVPLLLAAPVPKELQSDQGLGGTWRIAAMTTDGRPNEFSTTVRWRFADDAVIFNFGGEDRRVPAKIDRQGKPKTLDFTNGGYTLGVYEVSGDTLVLCMSRTGNRPADTAGGVGVVKYTFKREKDDKR